MENCSDNYTNYIPNVAQNIEDLGGWVSVGILGGVTSFILFCLYLYNVRIYIMENPSWARRHQAWITSLPMAISFLSMSSFFVPRAAVTCDTVKFTYMPFIMVQFVETTLVIGGGEKVLLDDLIRRNTQWYRLTLPFRIVQLCPFTITKNLLRWIVGMIYQAFVSQLLLTILMAVLEHAQVLQRDATNVAFSTILILNMVTFTVGLFFFNVLIVGLSAHLESKWPKFMGKYYALLCFIFVQKAHGFLISIFTFTNYESPILTWKTLDAMASMLEAFTFGILFFLFFKDVVVQDDSITHTNDSAANVVEGPLLPPQPVINELASP
ncbi:hypothetical protein DAPPUDRAFT_229590 [Daphnia pulex]|uniref:Uncharacterized protein n=1 Tax=Daphnia pulex TaxID=6669 RepID=E9HRF1_DAPPU|nr:hypothetical protein DAPPUDRAFT_229590 [Daphnia pulex]|eukprot:EFX65692.1 hypothetical protein DAPPUDRAFT_229590 [Daphnia pulex]